MKNRRGYRSGPNTAETKLENIFDEKRVYYSRRGYPDYIVFDKHKRLYGFIEVKPRKSSLLRGGQQLFKEFCERQNIPFAKWIPGEPFPFDNPELFN